MSTGTEEFTAEGVENMTLRAGVNVSHVDYNSVVRCLIDQEIQGGEMGNILKYLSGQPSVSTIEYTGAIRKWRNLTMRMAKCQEELREFGLG